jgi:hypothetical protein
VKSGISALLLIRETEKKSITAEYKSNVGILSGERPLKKQLKSAESGEGDRAFRPSVLQAV